MSQLLKNIKYTVLANLITLLISVVLTMIIPKRLGVANYGYYQLYIFYTSYASLFHLGIPDGIYLRIGGMFYQDLDKPKIKGQIVSLTLLSLVISLIGVIIVFLQGDVSSKQTIILCSIFSIVISNLKTLLLFVLQATNRIREYAKYTRIDRIIFFVFCVSYIILEGSSFGPIILSDLLSRLFSLVIVSIVLKDVYKAKIPKFRNVVKDTYDNINVGSKLMLSYVAGLLIIGVIRFSIEQKWSIEVFGKVSLVLSLSNMMMTFINAVSVVLFPMLRRSEKKDQMEIFKMFRNVLVPLTFFLLLSYYPLSMVIELWLPKYSSSLIYLGMLYPIFVYEGKVSLLSNTFLKTMRKEKSILTINIFSLVCSFVLSVISVFILGNLDLAVLSILIVIMLRSNISEIVVLKSLGLESNLTMIFEIILTAAFVVSATYLSPLRASICYLLVFGIYFLYMKRSFVAGIKKLVKEK